MYLSWFESKMRDLLALAETTRNERERYNRAHDVDGTLIYPEKFTSARLRLGELSLSSLTGRCYQAFAGYLCWVDPQIRGIIVHLSLLRNAFAHAHVEPHREFLLYTPDKRALPKLGDDTRCWKCWGYSGACNCGTPFVGEPPTLVIKADDPGFIDSFNDDLMTVDLKCFLPTAFELGVVYQGCAWWLPDGYLTQKVAKDQTGRLQIVSNVVPHNLN